ncbi:MAG: type IV pili methyl-accepting chemotaxis transducer N-terminal domain-containing protein [Paracoccaceae bacterium]
MPVKAAETVTPKSVAQEIVTDQIETDQIVTDQIDRAGRQRMLVQKIGRAACYVLGDIEKDKHQKMAMDGIAEFSNVQKWLRNGHPIQQWPAATDAALIANLDDVDRVWGALKAADSQLAYGDFHTIVVHQVLSLTDTVMAAANETVKTLSGLIDVGPFDSTYVKTLDVAGRQRMLTQRATKEFCFAALISDTADHRIILAQTMDEFERVLDNLLTGQDGLMEPPNILIKAQLERTQRTWVQLAALFELIKDSQNVTKEQMNEVAALSDKVLFQMNAAVHAYATLRP